MNRNGEMKQVPKRLTSVPVPAKIPDTFLIIPRSGRRSGRETEPVITIRVAKTVGGCRGILSRPVMEAFGYKNGGEKQFVQVFTSASTMKLVACSRDAQDARLIAGDGYITLREMADWFQLKDGMTFRCKAEVVKGKVPEIWATYPVELRDRIDEINGVMR